MDSNGSECRLAFFSLNSSECYVVPSYLVACSFTVNMILGLPANCYILWLSVNEMIRGQSTVIFVFNLALVEVIFCTSYVFFIKQYFFHCLECEMKIVFIGLIMWVGRPLFQSCICVERYLGVLHPLMFLKLKPMKYRILCCAVNWTVIMGSCVICTVYIDHLYNVILVEFLVFISIKLYSCLMVLKALRRPGPADIKERNRVHQDKLKAFRIILMVTVCSMLTYVPSIITLILYNIIVLEMFRLAWSVCVFSAVMFGFVQPFLHLKRVGKLPFC